jgi:hypothetical protein
MGLFSFASSGNRCSNCGKKWSDQELASYFHKRLSGSLLGLGASSVVSLDGVFSSKGLAFCSGCGLLTVSKGK